MLVTRLTGEANDARARFYEYVDNLENSLKAFGEARSMPLGSPLRPQPIYPISTKTHGLAAMSENGLSDYLPSSQAIHRALQRLGTTRLALFSPLPQLADRIERNIGRQGLRRGLHGLNARRHKRHRQYLRLENRKHAGSVEGARDRTGRCHCRHRLRYGESSAVAAPAERTGKPFPCSNICLAWALWTSWA